MKSIRFLSTVLLTTAMTVAGCTKKETPAEATKPAETAPQSAASNAAAAPNAAAPTTNESVTELKIEELKPGNGAEAKAGQQVTVHYTGWLTNGTKFDSSLDRGQPFKFQLGAGQVIQGWDKGVAGMKVGGKRKLVIPPTMGYGEHGAGGVIPPNATLVFEVELLGTG